MAPERLIDIVADRERSTVDAFLEAHIAVREASANARGPASGRDGPGSLVV
jgi:hypothetical protein